MPSKLLITGASGQLGRLVTSHLLAHHPDEAFIATTRSPASLQDLSARGVEVRAADFDHERGLAEAFEGAERALLISTDTTTEDGQRVEQHQRAIEAMAEAGVKHVIYTSLLNPVDSLAKVAPDHLNTEKILERSGLDFTILRNSVYTESLLMLGLPQSIKTGQFVDAQDTGKVSWVTREDCAKVAAAVLVAREHKGRHTLDVTGPQALSAPELVELTSKRFKQEITYKAISLKEQLQTFVQTGLPLGMADVFTSIYAAIRAGEYATTSQVVEQWTGEPSTSFEVFLEANKDQILNMTSA